MNASPFLISGISFPEELADRSWDNVGLLLGNIEPTDKVAARVSPKVLLTNDLTFAVGEEAIEKGASVIISYRVFPILEPAPNRDRNTQTAQILSSSLASSLSPLRTPSRRPCSASRSTTSPSTARTQPSTRPLAASTTGSSTRPSATPPVPALS